MSITSLLQITIIPCGNDNDIILVWRYGWQIYYNHWFSIKVTMFVYMWIYIYINLQMGKYGRVFSIILVYLVRKCHLGTKNADEHYMPLSGNQNEICWERTLLTTRWFLALVKYHAMLSYTNRSLYIPQTPLPRSKKSEMTCVVCILLMPNSIVLNLFKPIWYESLD